MNIHRRDLNSPAAPCLPGKQIELFAIRAAEIFDRVLTGKMLMCDAADILYDASVASGLEFSIGADNVQKILVAALASASASHDQRGPS